MTKQVLQRKEDIMTHLDIIRAWKDPEYQLSLSEAERALLPAHPAGLICELDTPDLALVMGGNCPATYAFNKVVNWITPKDGSIGEALEATAKAVIAWPAVGYLALWSNVEHEVGCH
jgi:mersacidin/lichenicidin family type 2 lantibiotic